jgi:glycerophosphoryl diester phosphodiesterase
MKKPFFLLLLFVSLKASAFDWQGHRGARGLYPENTLEGMRVALKYPITTLEFDVVITKDKQVLLSHEPWMNDEICQDPKGNRVRAYKQHNLYRLSVSEIQSFDCGSLEHPRFRGQKKMKEVKPLLAEVLEKIESEFKERKLLYNIEIKSTPEEEKEGFQPGVEEFTDLVVAKVKAHLPDERFRLQSFDFRVLRYLNKKYPNLQTVALVESNLSQKVILEDLGFKPTVFSPYFKNLSKALVGDWQKIGVKVIPWTVNEPKDLQRIKDMGVDGIITDYPDRISKEN